MSTISVPHILDNAIVRPRSLPLVPELQLYLMTDHYPTHSLQRDEYARLMQKPPYWAFCWGGGQALARWILDNPQQVAGRAVVDFGAGSAVAGIAAARSGAASVQAIDIDPDALQVSLLNAALNGVQLTVADHIEESRASLLLAADVGYEDAGFAAVVHHIESGGQAIVAESRLRNLHERFPALTLQARFRVRTFPDLDESGMFDDVHIYATAPDTKIL